LDKTLEMNKFVFIMSDDHGRQAGWWAESCTALLGPAFTFNNMLVIGNQAWLNMNTYVRTISIEAVASY
jgi:hypothetical protein